MKTIAIVGVVLIVLGVAALAYQGFTYTSRETVIDIGPLTRRRIERRRCRFRRCSGFGRGRRRGAAGRRLAQARRGSSTVYPVVHTCAEAFDVRLVTGVLHGHTNTGTSSLRLRDRTDEQARSSALVVALWLAPRAASELGERLADSAKGLGERASERLREVNARVGDTAGHPSECC